MVRWRVEKKSDMIMGLGTTDDEISKAAFDLLLKEPFYAHVLAGMPRSLTDEVETMGLQWNGQQLVLRVNPEWFIQGLAQAERKVALKHEVLHVVFRHMFRRSDFDPILHSIASDIVVNQLLNPLKPLAGWPTLKMFPELQLQPNQSLEVYYTALAQLFREMRQAGYGTDQTYAATGKRVAKDCSQSAKALAALLEARKKRGDDSGWHDGSDNLAAVAGRFAVGSLLIRARDRMPPHEWGRMPATLLSELAAILAERQHKLDWRRVVRIFCASSGHTKIRHTIKRVSQRYGTRPGIKVQRLQRLLIAVDTSGSIDQEMVNAFFTEIHAAWKAGAAVHIVECDAAVQRDYPYAGRPPKDISGGGGTEFEPVFLWMQKQKPFDGVLYLTDGCGPPPITRPRCKLLWVIAGDPNSMPEFSLNLPFGPSLSLQL
jgi:predicted metal-dependent peptidase